MISFSEFRKYIIADRNRDNGGVLGIFIDYYGGFDCANGYMVKV